MKAENLKHFFKANAIYLRGKSKLTQQQLGYCLKTKRSNIGAIEEGRSMGLGVIFAYSRYFNVSIDDLLTKKLTANDLKNEQSDS